jgi:hypothetical protein
MQLTGADRHVALRSPASGQGALAGQQALGAEEWPQGIGALAVRMGLHSGESRAREGDF